MAIFAFILGLVLVVAGAGSLMACFNLLPTDMGLLYAICGTLGLCFGAVTLAIGALIHRLGAIAATIQAPQNRDAWQIAPSAADEAVAAREPLATSVYAPVEPTFANEAPPVESEPAALDDDPINENRVGHLPTMGEIEHALAEPEAAPTLVGRYSSGGANYMIFSDGSIEAETEGGAFKFASMSEFKAYLAGERGG